MKRKYAVALWSLMLAPTPALAADLGASPAPEWGQPLVEIGSGWYIRGDIGASFERTPTVSFDPISLGTPPPTSIGVTAGSSTTKSELLTDVGFGYKFNSYFRADAEFDYRTGLGFNKTTSGIICPYSAMGLTSQTQTNPQGSPLLLGYVFDSRDTCNANFQLAQRNYTGLANGYFDLPGFWGISPYVGAGLGLNVQSTSGSLTYTKTSDGTSYRADLTPTGSFPLVWVDPITGLPINPQPHIAFAQQNWDRNLAKTRYSLAIALMAGVGIALSPNATLDLSYRYMDLGSRSFVINAQTGATFSQKNTTQDFRVGIRYMPDWTF